eukprot:TRINITY_DN6982_c0_g1_i1.p1 TRINITY_DN6982_c0_g1~~TRINITY_DN6982_c0_g1_i1.p1  ORF type:complete len:338 (+),score=67.00 TRINITY_DN6982_c0_g1_i1:69-1016(+)
MEFSGQIVNFDAKTIYSQQLARTDKVAKTLKGHISLLKGSLCEESTPNKDDILAKQEHLKASCSVYLGVRRFCKTMDVSLEDKYEAFDEDGHLSEKKSEMDDVYNQMTHLLHVFETRMQAFVQAPNDWFSTHLIKANEWMQANPMITAGIPLAVGTGIAGGHCLIFYLCYGSSSASLGVNTALGATVTGGFLAAALLVLICGCAIKCYDKFCVKDDDKTSEALKSIDAVVEKMKGMTSGEIIKQLKEIHDLCDKAVGVEIPQLPDDEVCMICLQQGSSVEQPTRAPRCQGQHYMCKECWLTCLHSHGDKCPSCRV